MLWQSKQIMVTEKTGRFKAETETKNAITGKMLIFYSVENLRRDVLDNDGATGTSPCLVGARPMEHGRGSYSVG